MATLRLFVNRTTGNSRTTFHPTNGDDRFATIATQARDRRAGHGGHDER
jgi:hypothetical protein